MIRIFFLTALIAINFVLSSQIVFSQDVLGQSVTKNQILGSQMDFTPAIKFALENNNNIRAVRKNLSSTEREIGIKRAAMLPKINFLEEFVATNNPGDVLRYKMNQSIAYASEFTLQSLNNPKGTTNFLTSIIAEQKIIDIKSIIKIITAKKEYSSNGYFYLRKQEELINQVAQAYITVNLLSELEKVTQQSILETSEQLKVSEEKYQKNKGILADYIRAKTEVGKRKEKLIVIQRNLSVAKRALGLHLGLESSIEITDTIPNFIIYELELYKQAGLYRNDVKATEIKVDTAHTNIRAAQADWYPTLSTFAYYNFYDANAPFTGSGQNYIATVNFKWEAFDGNKRVYETRKARDKLGEAKEYLEGLRKQVDFKIFEAYATIEENKRKLEIALMVQKRAEEDLKLIEDKWKKSQLPFVSLVDAQDDLDEARADVIKSKNGLRTAAVSLYYESGLIYQALLN